MKILQINNYYGDSIEISAIGLKFILKPDESKSIEVDESVSMIIVANHFKKEDIYGWSQEKIAVSTESEQNFTIYRKAAYISLVEGLGKFMVVAVPLCVLCYLLFYNQPLIRYPLILLPLFFFVLLNPFKKDMVLVKHD